MLDVGCGEGDLLQLLEARGIDGRGIELSREGVNRCVSKGLAVVQGDADTDLVNYPDDAFDYVILSQTLQATRQPKVVLENLLRIGRRAIVSFPNFGFWKMRLQLLVGGHMPRTENLPATWYDTPNIHFCTIKDFVQLCDEINVKMERAVALDLYGRPLRLNAPWWFWNMFGEQGVFLLSRAGNPPGRHAGDFCDDIGIAFFEFFGMRHGLIAKTLQAFFLKTRADAGQRQRQRALRRLDADLQRRIGAHRQPDQMGRGNFQMIEHRDRVVAEMLVAVGIGIGDVRGDVAARRIGDAAMAAREVAHLRLPARIVGGKLVNEQDRRSAAGFLKIKLHIV